MEINGIVHCLFEQSGTFKNEFKKMGFIAFDYDIQNEYNETDFKIDLFVHIENAYLGIPSIFDSMQVEDLVLAFFPCTYFETMSMMFFDGSHLSLKNKSMVEKIEVALARLEKREKYFKLLYKLISICCNKNLRLIIENPASRPNYLFNQNFFKPSFIDYNRQIRGDYFRKPTAYWFFNCSPSSGMSLEKPIEQRKIINSKPSNKVGLCSKERSEISAAYARNFICDFIINKIQKNTYKDLFYETMH